MGDFSLGSPVAIWARGDAHRVQVFCCAPSPFMVVWCHLITQPSSLVYVCTPSVVRFFLFILSQKQDRESPRHEVRELRRHGQSCHLSDSQLGTLDTQQQCATRRFLVCDNFEKDLIFSMTVLICAEIALVRPGNFVLFDICEYSCAELQILWAVF